MKRVFWTPFFSRHLINWEIKIVKHLFLRLQEKEINKGGEDKVIWFETRSRTFFVKTLHSILELGRLAPFQVGVVWNSWVPLKVSFFCLGGDFGEKF